MSSLFGKSKVVGQLAKQTTCYATNVSQSQNADKTFCPPKPYSVRENFKLTQKSTKFDELFYGNPMPVKCQANYKNPTKYGDWATNGRTSDF